MRPSPVKSKSRSVRLSKEVEEVVRKDASEQNVSFNELVNRILTKYAQWDRNAERFGMLATTREGLISLIKAIPEARLMRLSDSFSKSTTGELLNFWHSKSDVRGFVSFLELYTRYGGLGTLSVDDHGSSISILLRHRLGRKGSVVIAGWLGSFCERILGEQVEFSIGLNSISGEINLKKHKEKIEIVN